MDFFKMAEEHRQKEESLKWEGSFRDYFQMVIANPLLEQTSHSRLYQMVKSKGVETTSEGFKRYGFFANELFGIEATLERITEEYLHAAAHKLEVKKRILLLMGPVSGGKSTLVTMLKRGLEEFTKTDIGALYGIKGCPMHETPMHLIPDELRPEVKKEYGIQIEGDLCPYCRYQVKNKLGGIYENMPVERIFLSEKDRIGVGTFVPSDEKDQDLADLVGSVDISNITEYGSESDPRAYRFDGELNIANRGIMEFQEMLKVGPQFLWSLLSLSQEGNFKAGRFALISADEVIVAHTNENEYKSFITNKANEALQSRMIIHRIPYNLKLDEEIKIYEKLIGQSEMQDTHIAPNSFKMAGIFSILTRLKMSPKLSGLTLLTKLKLYNGEDSDGYKTTKVRELMLEGYEQKEGMSGIDPRYVINRISAALIKSGTKCINSIDVLKALKDGLDQSTSISQEEKSKYQDFVNIARKEYDEIAKNEVYKAFVYAYEDSAKTLLANYLDNVEAFCSKSNLKDPITEEEVAPDEKLMRSIEEQIKVSDGAKESFRKEIMIAIGACARKCKTFDYDSHQQLKSAIEKKLFADLKDVVKITTSVKTPDEAQLKKINEVAKEMIEKHGYCAICANETIKYVGSLLNR